MFVKRTITVLLALLLSCLCLFANGAEEAAETANDEIVELDLMIWDGGEFYKDLKEYTDSLLETDGIKVNIILVPGVKEYYNKMNALMAADDLPDIFQNVPYVIKTWANAGYLADMTPYLNEMGVDIDAELMPAAILRSDNNDLWGITKGPVCHFLYYNKDAFDAAGVEYPSSDPDNPWTWDQYQAAAEKLTFDDKGNIYGSADFNSQRIKQYGAYLNVTNPTYTLGLLYSNDAAYSDPSRTKLGADSPQAIECFNAFKYLMDTVAPGREILPGLPNLPTMMKSGQAAMGIEGLWMFQDFKKAGVNFGIAPLPMFKKPMNVSHSSLFAVAHNSEHPAEAAKVIYKMLNPDCNPTVTKYSLPDFKKSFEEDQLAVWASDEAYSAEFREMIPKIMNIAVTPELLTLVNYKEIVEQTIMPALDKAFLGEATVEEVAATFKDITKGMFVGD